MAMESYMKGVAKEYEKPVQPVQTVKQAQPAQAAKQAEFATEPVSAQTADGQDIETLVALMNGGKEKDPAKSTIDSAISGMNARMAKTRCAYAYDEGTKRITIKVYDDETDELIREVPPEKSLEALKKIWELAGIFIDEKR